MDKKQTVRTQLLHEAATLVDGERNNHYGDPIGDFRCTADLWNIYLGRITETSGNPTPQIQPHDVAIMMILLKVSRIGWSANKQDSWTDIAGYAACGWDCIGRETNP